MKDRPLICTGDSVVKIISGQKTKTRRVIASSDQGPNYCTGAELLLDGLWYWQYGNGQRKALLDSGFSCPYARFPADHGRLWVRETWCLAGKNTWDAPKRIDPKTGDAAYFKAEWDRSPPSRWRSPIHMPRWASRIELEVTSIRVERLQAIDGFEAIAEGVDVAPIDYRVPEDPRVLEYEQAAEARRLFVDLWNSINAGRGFGWEVNPWVWVVGFKRLEAKERAA